MLAAQWPEIRCWRIEARSGSVEAIVLMRQPVLSKQSQRVARAISAGQGAACLAQGTSQSVKVLPSSPEVILLVVLMYVPVPLSLRTVEDLPFERGINVWHETWRMWRNCFDPLFAADLRR